MKCPHYKVIGNYCASCAGDAARRYETALKRIIERADSSEENPVEMLTAIVRIAREGLK